MRVSAATGMMAVMAVLLTLSCQPVEEVEARPNVILIMADDMGYECLGCYGGTSYRTPVLDSLASRGMRFDQCVSQPLCTPSRVKIMTGMYNYRNYDHFGNLDPSQYSFGNLMRDAGYATCIAGKWQLNGISHKEEVPDWDDKGRPNRLGFDEYCLWQLTHTRGEGERYAGPLIDQNGTVLEGLEDGYGPDIFVEYILDFIERKKDQPFFVYYPMVLVHEPFVPTPDSQEWAEESRRYERDTDYFADMVAYADKIVGRIQLKLEELGLEEDTILIFTGDNGTDRNITSLTMNGIVQGGKGTMRDAGTHVPLIVSWPRVISEGRVYGGLIEFSDFFPTFAELVGSPRKSDGKSFLPLLLDGEYQPREHAFVHYDPRWGQFVNSQRNRFARTVGYKLYQDGRFYDLVQDILEENPLDDNSLTADQRETRASLQKELGRHPPW